MKTIIHILCLVLLFEVCISSVAQAQRRRGWSPQAKGTAIGVGAGAAAGAIINKRNRVVGGVIGGLAGGAAGYAIGKHKDNKNKAAARRAAEERATLARAEAAKTTPATSTNQVSPTTTNVAAVAPAPVNAVNTLYLPNDATGNRDAPYASSEYRRKSW